MEAVFFFHTQALQKYLRCPQEAFIKLSFSLLVTDIARKSKQESPHQFTAMSVFQIRYIMQKNLYLSAVCVASKLVRMYGDLRA